MDHRDFKTTVTRPFHIGTKPPTDAYRDGWDRIFGKRDAPGKKQRDAEEPNDAPG